MSTGIVMPAARRGDRHSDSTRFDDAEGTALLGAVLGEIFGSIEGAVGALGAQIGGGLTHTVHQVDITVRQVVGRRVTGALEWASHTVFLGPERLFAAIVDPDDESDMDDDEKLESGALGVFVQGLRLGRAGDHTVDGCTVFEGDPTILVGGPPTEGQKLDPSSVVKGGLDVLATAAVGAVLSHPSVVATAAEWGAMMGQAHAGADALAAEVKSASEELSSATATLAAKAGALLGGEASGIAGALFAGWSTP